MLIQGYIEDVKQEMNTRGVSDNYNNMIVEQSREFLTYMSELNYELEEITPSIIQEYFTDYLETRKSRLGSVLSESSLRHHYNSINSLYQTLFKCGKVKMNPLDVFKSPTVNHVPRIILDREEITALFKACETKRDKALLILLYGLGLRRSEVEKVLISHINFQTKVITVQGKYNKKRRLPLQTEMVEDLKDYYFHERDSYLKRVNHHHFLINDSGYGMTGVSVNQRLKEILKFSGISKNISCHNLRHTIATHLLEEGVEVEYVKRFLGHVVLDTTLVYTKNLEHQNV